MPQFANALQGPGRQSQHLEPEDNAETALLYMQFRHHYQGRNVHGMCCHQAMAYVFHANDLPPPISEVPGCERILFNKGAGVDLAPPESATIRASDGALKLFVLVVAKIPK